MGSLLNGFEQRYFDSIALEVLTLAGTDNPTLWKFSPTGNALRSQLSGVSGIVDIYSEPKISTSSNRLRVYTPYKVMCFFEKPGLVVDAGDTGLSRRTEGKFWLSRKDLENRLVPTNDLGYHVESGDIIELWSRSKVSWYFEIINAERDGFEHDSPVWTYYECDAVRSENFTPERKIK